jgi:ADP-heptose:LPS heptosyltransferase
MSERVESEASFLEVVASGKKFISTINKCSDEQIKAIFECIYNIDTLPLEAKEGKKINKFRKLINNIKDKKWSVLLTRHFFLRNKRFVITILQIALAKLLENLVFSFCNG